MNLSNHRRILVKSFYFNTCDLFTLDQNYHNTGKAVWYVVLCVALSSYPLARAPQCRGPHPPASHRSVRTLPTQRCHTGKYLLIVLMLMTSWTILYKTKLKMKVREDFIISEKAPIRAFIWLKAPTSPLKFKTLC